MIQYNHKEREEFKMNVKELMAYAKVNTLDKNVSKALLQEFASFFDDSNEEDLIDNLKEYHEDLFEDEKDC